jgi:hypothetical protein
MNYEIELMANNKLARKALFVGLGTLAFGVLLYVLSVAFWDQVGHYQTFRGGTRASGWPNTIRVLSFYLVPAGVGIAFIGLRRMNQKKAGYALNRNGVMLNNNGWTEAYFEWSEISSLEEIADGKRIGVIMHLKDLNQAIAKPGQKYHSFLRTQHIERKKPVAISSDLIKGDASIFISQMKKYYAQGKI